MIKYLKKNLEEKHNQKKIIEIIEKEDFLPINNILPKKVETVVFVIARMLKYSGGYTSILRLGSELEKQGIHVLYAITSKYQSVKSATENALLNLPGYKGKIIRFDEIDETLVDVIIATYWRTVYACKKINAYKMYFIQDYEPYFSQFGEEYLLARKTYQMGFHMVSLGAWNAYMIKRECSHSESIDVISFPFEPNEYKITTRSYGDLKYKSTYKLAVFLKSDQKRLPNIINEMVGNLVKEFENHGKKLDVTFFGIDRKFKITCGRNLGFLNKNQLRALYEESDFGMCASMTNISLVPFEMIASGLPVIEFEEGTFPFFFPKEAGILTDFAYVNLYKKLEQLISTPDILEEKMRQAQEYLTPLSWENTGREFYNILREI